MQELNSKPGETLNTSVKEGKEVLLQVQLEPGKYSSENMIVRLHIYFCSMTFMVIFTFI